MNVRNKIKLSVALALGMTALGCTSSGTSETSVAAPVQVQAAAPTSTDLVDVVPDKNDPVVQIAHGFEYYVNAKVARKIRLRIKMARHGLNNGKHSKNSLKMLAYGYLSEGNAPSALRVLSIMEERRIDLDSEAYLIRGVAHLMNNQDSQGFQALKKSHNLNSSSSLPLLNLGLYEKDRGNAFRALNYFRQAANARPSNKVSHIHAASMAFQIKQYKLAEKHLKSVLAVDPMHPIANYNIGIVYHYGFQNYSSAKSHLKKVFSGDRADKQTQNQAIGAYQNASLEEDGKEGLATIGKF